MAEAAGRIGQAQGSTGLFCLATDRRATDPTMEQGLETRQKGEGARRAV
jgi:hypothetical protein